MSANTDERLAGLIQRLALRVLAGRAKFESGLSPVMKELRSYSVRTLPVLKDLIGFFRLGCETNPLHSLVESKCYGLLPHSELVSVETTLNKMFDGVFKTFDHRALGKDTAVKIKLTKKTIASTTGMPLKDTVVEILRSFTEGTGGIIKWSLLLDRLGHDWCSPHSDEPFLVASIKLIYDVGSDPFVDHMDKVHAFRKEWCMRQPQLELKSKVYISRSDDRAYVHCHDTLAHLSGAILQSLMSPKDKRRYRSTSYGYWVKRVGKNIIHRSVPAPIGSTVRTILMDVRSFTSSGVNSNILILCMMMGLIHGVVREHWGSEQVFCVQGEYFRARLQDVFYAYFRSTFLAPLKVESLSLTTFVLGGYLGIPANMTTTMYTVLIVLSYVEQRSQELGVRLYSDPGGDDISIVLQGELSDVDELTGEIRDLMSTYIGDLKEYIVTDVEPYTRDRTIGEFCKKEVIVSRDETTFTMDSIHQLPILEALLAKKTPAAARKDWIKFYASVVETTKRYDSPELAEAFVRVYERMHDFCAHTGLIIRPEWDNEEELVEVEGMRLSYPAYRKAAAVSAVLHDDRMYRTTMSENANLLLARDDLVQLQFSDFALYDIPKGTCRRPARRMRLYRPQGETVDMLSAMLWAALVTNQ